MGGRGGRSGGGLGGDAKTIISPNTSFGDIMTHCANSCDIEGKNLGGQGLKLVGRYSPCLRAIHGTRFMLAPPLVCLLDTV